MEWCKYCQDSNDVITEKARHEQHMWVYRKRCARCGKPIQWGIARQYLTMGAGGLTDTPSNRNLIMAAWRWVKTAGRDRT